MTQRIVPTYVRDFATQHRIDVSKVKSESDIMTFLDISKYAKARGDTELQTQALTAQFKWNADGATSASVSRTASSGNSRHIPVNAMAHNPLVDQVRAQAAAGQCGMPTGAAPSLFVAGDTPSFTASGIPPQAVLDVPWQARHAMAAAPTPAKAYEIANQCSGPDAATTAEMYYGNDAGNQDYAYRVQQWQVAAMSDDQLYNSTLPGSQVQDEMARREAALPELPEGDAAVLDDWARKNLGV
jgi:hypothetical protein